MAEKKKVKKNEKALFIANMASTISWIKSNNNEFLKPFGISNQQYNILRILMGAGDWLDMGSVKKRMYDASPNATRLADKLLTKKLIERKGSAEDRRVVFVNITKAGLALIKKIDSSAGPDQHGFLDKITIKEAKIASEIISKLRT